MKLGEEEHEISRFAADRGNRRPRRCTIKRHKPPDIRRLPIMHRKINTLALICVSIAAAAFAQDLPMAKPESVGVSSERLERIGTAVQRSIDEKRIAGAITLVARRGRVVWFKPQGMMDREASTPPRMLRTACCRTTAPSKTTSSAWRRCRCFLIPGIAGNTVWE